MLFLIKRQRKGSIGFVSRVGAEPLLQGVGNTPGVFLRVLRD